MVLYMFQYKASELVQLEISSYPFLPGKTGNTRRLRSSSGNGDNGEETMQRV